MRRAWMVALVVGLGLAGPGCFFQKVNQRLAAQPEPRAWEGRLDLYRTVVSWDDEAVGVGVSTVYQRVDARTWRGPGGNFTVEGRYVRGPNVVAELIETKDGWDVRVSGPGASGYWEFLRQREPDPAPQGLVRVARVERKSWFEEPDDGIFVRPEQAEAGLPWPQVGLAVLARIGELHSDALPTRLGRPSPKALAFGPEPRPAPRVDHGDNLSHAQRMQRLKEHWARPQPPAGPQQQQQRPQRQTSSTKAQ